MSLAFFFLAKNGLLCLRYLERCEELRDRAPDKLKDHPRPKATYHLIQPRQSMPQVQKVIQKMRNSGKIPHSPDVRVTTFKGSLVAYNTNTVMLVPAMSAPCHQAALMFATGCTINQLGVCAFACKHLRSCAHMLHTYLAQVSPPSNRTPRAGCALPT